MLINIIITVFTLLVASIYDLKKGTVPGIVLYPAIIIGFFITIINISQMSALDSAIALIIPCIVLVIGIVLYELKVLWGADILLFLGIVLLTPVQFILPEYYIGLFGFSFLCATAYYIILRLTTKNSQSIIKFIPAIAVGYIVSIIGLFLPVIITNWTVLI